MCGFASTLYLPKAETLKQPKPLDTCFSLPWRCPPLMPIKPPAIFGEHMAGNPKKQVFGPSFRKVGIILLQFVCASG